MDRRLSFMIPPPRPLARVWFVLPVLAGLVVLGLSLLRIRQVDFMTQLGNPELTVTAASPTGYAGGMRLLLVPGHDNDSYELIAQTQLLLAEGRWRLRHVSYDNAPDGRAVRSTSAARWWLAAVAWGHHALTGQPIGLSVERAALWAGPVLQLLLIAAVTWLVSRSLGPRAGACAGVATAALYPLTASIVPGAPEAGNLAEAFLLLSVLSLLSGLWRAGESDRRTRGAFVGSGIYGGLAIWAGIQVIPVLVALGVSALVGSWMTRRDATAPAAPWRQWGFAGAATILGLFLLENAPDSFDWSGWHLTEVHPLHALAWLGGAELLQRLERRRQTGGWRRHDAVIAALGLLASLAAPVAMLWKGKLAILADESVAASLSMSRGGTESHHLLAWLAAEGLSIRSTATVLPLLVGLSGAWFAWRAERNGARRLAIGLIVGAALALTILSGWQLSRWTQVDLVLVGLTPLLVAASTPASRTLPGGSIWLAGGALASLLGILAALPPKLDRENPVVSAVDLQGLVERDFAHWLARRVGPDGATVLAPPSLTAAIIFHGGLRGLGSPFRGNEEGFRASIHLAAATSADEALALVNRRGVTHIAIPSWDGFMDEYARLGADQPEHSLVGLLHSWLPPRWLRPVAFQLPGISGFEDQSLALFEVVELQDNLTALTKLADFFAQSDRLDQAVAVSQTLNQLYPDEPDARLARAQVAIATRQDDLLQTVLPEILSNLKDGLFDGVTWDRHVKLALILAETRHLDESRAETRRCLEDMDEGRLRALSLGDLQAFLRLCHGLHEPIADPKLRDLAEKLLPPDLREKS